MSYSLAALTSEVKFAKSHRRLAGTVNRNYFNNAKRRWIKAERKAAKQELQAYNG